jgi:hypothetical protein
MVTNIHAQAALVAKSVYFQRAHMLDFQNQKQ